MQIVSASTLDLGNRSLQRSFHYLLLMQEGVGSCGSSMGKSRQEMGPAGWWSSLGVRGKKSSHWGPSHRGSLEEVGWMWAQSCTFQLGKKPRDGQWTLQRESTEGGLSLLLAQLGREAQATFPLGCSGIATRGRSEEKGHCRAPRDAR